jgi:prevent-host-death family protein
MQKIHLTQDIRPLSEFRAKIGTFIQQVHKTNRPIVITHHGKSAAVLINADAYVSLVDQLELLDDIHRAEDDIKSGRVLSHTAAKKRILKSLRK